MKTGYVSINNAIKEWTEDTDLAHEEIKPELLIRWATDCVRMINTDQQLRHRIGLFQVENSRVQLPNDFVMLCQAASNVFPDEYCDCSQDPDCCAKNNNSRRTPKSRREDIVQWVQGTLEKDCELEINLVCPDCHKTACECNTPVVEVDVDRVWEMAHPEIYYRHHTRIGRFGYGPGPWSSYYTPKFKLMRYASNDYYNLKHVLGGCPNVNCPQCINEFIIDLPYIEVDFERGEILVSYLGKVLDEKGDYMIPDHPDVFSAIFWHLESKWFWMEYRRTLKDNAIKSQELYRAHKTAEQNRELAIGQAKSKLELPAFAEFKNWLDNNYYKRIPNFHHHENLNALTPDEYNKYSQRLEGGTDSNDRLRYRPED